MNEPLLGSLTAGAMWLRTAWMGFLRWADPAHRSEPSVVQSDRQELRRRRYNDIRASRLPQLFAERGQVDHRPEGNHPIAAVNLR
jgi:hypothetical protein